MTMAVSGLIGTQASRPDQQGPGCSDDWLTTRRTSAAVPDGTRVVRSGAWPLAAELRGAAGERGIRRARVQAASASSSAMPVVSVAAVVTMAARLPPGARLGSSVDHGPRRRPIRL